MTIWQQLTRPFLVLAPMDDVTDTVFREIVAQVAAPELAFTEFASTDGFVHPSGRPSVERRLLVTASESAAGVPLIAQIWGSNPQNYEIMARGLATRRNEDGRPLFAGIDINMGCPEKGIVKRGCCGGLIKAENWQTAAEIIQATKAGAGRLPVSVKTRIGVNQIVTEDWASHLLSQGIAALTIHGRTVRELSRVPARWDEIAKVVKLRDRMSPQTKIIGNGDVMNRAHGLELIEQSGADGAMIGRGVLRNIQTFNSLPPDTVPERQFELLRQHLDLYEKTWGDTKSYEPMKKFAKLYINGFPNASAVRARLMDTHSAAEARHILEFALVPVSAN